MKFSRCFSALALAMGLGLLAANLGAAEKKALGDVDSSVLIRELQQMSNDQGIVVAWWMPSEFWEVALASEKQLTPAQMEEVMKVLRQYTFIAVVDGEVGGAAIDFKDRAAVAKSMSVEVLNGAGKSRKVDPVDPVPDDVQPLLTVLVPAMGAAMGNLGRNLHFFVFKDQEKDARIFSPFEPGSVVVKLSGRERRPDISLAIDRPVDSLLVPRLCANGKPAHVSWTYCPWDGKKLPE
jgi:hypothetical protein